MSQDLPPSPESANSDPLKSSATTPESDTEIVPEPIDPTEPVVEVSSELIDTPVTAPSSATPPVRQTVRRTSRRRAPEDDEILPQTLLRLLGEAIVAAQPVLKQQSIKALKGTIHLLESAVERLEAAPTPKQRKAPAPGTATESVLPPTSVPNTGELAPPPSTADLQAKFRTVWQQVQRQWGQMLRQVRDRLPASVNQLSDQALTGAIAGVLVILLWLTSSLLPDQPKPAAIAKPSAETAAPAPVPTPSPTPVPPVVKAPETPTPIAISPSPVAPSPPPPLKLTPEQELIARIQDRVAEISDQYATGLIQSVQANFRSSRLIVNVSNGWYGLGRSQQDKLAGEILHRTQELDFTKLELVDEAGTLLARSPVVGTDMIILKRATAAAAAA